MVKIILKQCGEGDMSSKNPSKIKKERLLIGVLLNIFECFKASPSINIPIQFQQADLKTRAENPACIKIHEESEVSTFSKTRILKENGYRDYKITSFILMSLPSFCSTWDTLSWALDKIDSQ